MIRCLRSLAHFLIPAWISQRHRDCLNRVLSSFNNWSQNSIQLSKNRLVHTCLTSSVLPLLSLLIHNCQRVSRFVITFAASLISFLTTFLSTVIPFTVRIRRDRSLLTIGPNSHSLKFCYIFNECTACIIVFHTTNRYNFGIYKNFLLTSNGYYLN